METQSYPPTPPPIPNFLQRYAFTLKGIIMFFLTLFLLIPANMVESLINERQQRRAEAIREVSSKWGNSQTLTGPVLVVPYDKINRDDKGKEYSRDRKFGYFLPDTVHFAGKVEPEIRHRGIFEVVLYNSRITANGSFGKLGLESNFTGGEANILWSDAFMVCGIPDLRGLEDQAKLLWNGSEQYFEAGISAAGIASSGVHVPVAVEPETGKYDFTIAFDLRGSGSLSFTPLGRVTETTLESGWKDPKFSGAFLPDDHAVTNDGFKANWKVLHLNRNYPQVWNSDQEVSLESSSFGVDFLLPVDNYQKSIRSVKYAVLFIALTFLVLFFIEMRQPRRVHPFQYALIGVALIVFYTLLVSISEQLSFNIAYALAAGMTLLLIGLFAKSLFSSVKMGMLVTFTLGLLYAYLFVILQLQDFAFLFGSLGLFAILAGVMYFSRKMEE